MGLKTLVRAGRQADSSLSSLLPGKGFMFDFETWLEV